MSELDREPFPRGALIAAASVVAFTLVATASARLLGINPAGPPSMAGPAQSVELRFVDEPNGSVNVRDGRDDHVVAYLAPGTNGFIRGVMRGLAHDRKTRGIGSAPPFRLSVWRDGRLALQDTATGRFIDLDAFGASNKDAFVQLLHADGGLV
jgi:putative photosynthetic complex assembly protein